VTEEADYALATERLADELLAQNVIYAEITLSAGVMLWRSQDADANLLAIHEAGLNARKRGLRMQWIPDATRQFGAEAAMAVAQHAARCKSLGVVAFGMGGDELSIPAEQFREAYEYAASEELHRVAHAGEIGGPREVRAAVEFLGAERIGHGIAVMHDALLMQFLTERRIPLEICPTSNLCTGALARQLGKGEARLEEHPLPRILREGVPATLSTDDPAMFRTTLNGEYAAAQRLGLSPRETMHLAKASFEFAFLARSDKEALLAQFQQGRREHGLV